MLTRLVLFTMLLFLTSCNKDEPGNRNVDYRMQYIGTYDCTKSTTSFEDDLFTTDTEVTIEIDTNLDTLIMGSLDSLINLENPPALQVVMF